MSAASSHEATRQLWHTTAASCVSSSPRKLSTFFNAATGMLAKPDIDGAEKEEKEEEDEEDEEDEKELVVFVCVRWPSTLICV
jgi:hypothetical protein